MKSEEEKEMKSATTIKNNWRLYSQKRSYIVMNI